ncbi:hypothetical protein [Clostridium tyrobutyricum]|uniref:hypothetical protein n=1 Tax=Clostridium tyrobutyricum TaxID=1519 RepID=UPI0003A6E4A3|nr:hypothetical protein [Clostridium tyrobutyricum]
MVFLICFTPIGVQFFEYKQKKSPSIEEDTFTQFGYACKQLEIEIKTSSIQQAKWHVERIFQTLQSRLSIEKINLILGVLASRKVDNESCVKYNKRYHLPVDANGHPVYYHKDTCGTVIKAFNNDIYFCVNEKVYALELLPDHVSSPKNFDLANTSKVPKKHYIPPISHPWKQASSEHYCNKQLIGKKKIQLKEIKNHFT